jgi:5-methyltetrahydropteroyltriglutamate--homocysteine methyltransferase
MTATRAVARAESVGSLLRNPAVLAQMQRVFDDSLTCARPLVMSRKADRLAELQTLADQAIRDLVARQINAGLDVVTDGEVRRGNFVSSFTDSLGSLGEPQRRADVFDDTGDGTSRFVVPVFAQRLRKTYAPAVEEVVFLRSITDSPFKVTLPAPSGFFSDFVDIGGSPYKGHAEFVQDAVEVMQQIVAEVA